MRNVGKERLDMGVELVSWLKGVLGIVLWAAILWIFAELAMRTAFVLWSIGGGGSALVGLMGLYILVATSGYVVGRLTSMRTAVVTFLLVTTVSTGLSLIGVVPVYSFVPVGHPALEFLSSQQADGVDRLVWFGALLSCLAGVCAAAWALDRHQQRPGNCQ